jgi:transcription initiation factor IIE alpha subunit
MIVSLFYTCPKRKCRHTWERQEQVVINDNCPECGAKDLCPVDMETRHSA